MHGELTESIDVAQVVLYLFWLFFFGLIFWLRREDRREGYPLEADGNGHVLPVSPIFIPPPKTFLLPDGGIARAPNYARDVREISAERISPSSGYPLEPVGDALRANVGPASWAERSDTVELTREGHDLIVPMRLAEGFTVSAGPDPRGWKVLGGDGKEAGVVTDLWVDRADIVVRYVELKLGGGEGTRLIPITMLRLLGDTRSVDVYSLLAAQFAGVPTLKNAERITTLEEERISAFYAGGRLYAEPRRLGPVL